MALKNGIPSGWRLKGSIREHTAIPTDVLDATICSVLKPVARNNE